MKKLIFMIGLMMLTLSVCFGQTQPITDIHQTIGQQCVQFQQAACIDWNQRRVYAIGYASLSSESKNPAQGFLIAQRIALLDAQRNLLGMINGIHISSESTVEQWMKLDDRSHSLIKGQLRFAEQIGKTIQHESGIVEIRLTAPLGQILKTEMVYPTTFLPSVSSSASSQTQITKRSVQSDGIDINQVYTGLIVDARGTGIIPALSPKIKDESGNEVYGSAQVSRDFVVKYGMSSYLKNVEQARQNDRVKGNPLVIKALRGAERTNLIISNTDGEALKVLVSTQSFLRECRLVIILE